MTTAQAPSLVSSRYEIVDELGVGGMGTVYRAKDRLTGQLVALKQMLFHAKTNSAVLAQEFKFLASLRHPHIISVLDYGFDTQGYPFYTMTLLEAAQEFAVIAVQRDLDGKIALLLQVLQALAYLHRRGILHRDLKPENVLVDAQAQVKVVDFGLAVAADQETARAGTLAYMAPEVLRGESAVVQSDLYAVGVMAYELFAGHLPYEAPHSIALAYKVFNEPLDLQPLAIAPYLVAIIAKLLAKSVEDRYATANEVMHVFAEATGQPLLLETQATRESFLQAAHFVGRDSEFKLLNDALMAAAESSGSAWLIGGESGVGKSRLIDELQTQAMLRGALVLRGQAVAQGGTPYLIWRDAIRRLVLQTELTDYEASVLKSMLPDIGTLLDREVSDPPQIDAQSLQLRLWTVIELIFTQPQLVVLLLEDLHWADDSLVILHWLIELAKRSPLLIVGTYRDDERPTLPAEFPGAQHIKLSRLSPESIAQLSASMLGQAGASQGVLNLLERETEGNVFFIVEVVRALAEEVGGLANVGRKTLPERVFAGGMQAVIKRRLDKVPESAQRLMAVAAVVGREFDLKILQVIAPTLDTDEWLQQVATVIEAQDDHCRFSHDKLRQGVLVALEADQRQHLHREVAHAIETAYPDSPEQYAALAYHWGQAQDAAKTIHTATLAGQQALRSGSYREAIRFFEQALEWADQARLDNRQLGYLHYLIGDAYWGQSDMARSYESHVRALHLLGFSVPQGRGQLTLRSLRPLLNHLGRRLFHTHHQASNAQALIIAAEAFHQIAQGSYHDANFALGFFCIFSGLDAAERAGNSPEAVRLQERYYISLGFAMGDIALHGLARSYIKLAENHLKTNADPETLAWFDFIYGLYLAGLGQWQQSNQLLEESMRLSKAAGSLGLWVEIGQLWLRSLCLQSRFAEATAANESVGQVALRDGHIQTTGLFNIMKARLVFLQGKTREAREQYFDNQTIIEASLHVGDQTVSQIAANGFLVELYARSEEWVAALNAAETLNGLIKKAQTVSFVLAGEAAAPIALYLTLWEKQADPSYGKMAQTLLNLFHRKYTRHYDIGHPVEYMYRCWYHWLNRNEQQARAVGNLAIQTAQTYQMPYYEAAARYHLARFMAKDDPERVAHLKVAAVLFEQIGAVYDLQCVREAL